VPDAPDRRERLLNLLAALLKERGGLTRDEILQNPSMGYGVVSNATRRSFERDKASLRAMGVPLRDSTFNNVTRYFVDPKEYYLPDLDLTPDELAALHVAVTAVGLGTGAGEGALMKLGGLEGTGGMPVAELPSAESLAPLFDASRRGAVVDFEYRGRRRELEPWGLTSKSGHWYVVGYERSVSDMRIFRADRIDGEITVGEPGAFEAPGDFRADAYLEDQPWEYGGGRATTVRIRVDPGHEQGLLARAGPGATGVVGEDGSVEVELSVTSPEALRSYVLGFLEHAEVVAPPELRADMVAWLQAFADAEATA
jgi:proteasome accessory factor B